MIVFGPEIAAGGTLASPLHLAVQMRRPTSDHQLSVRQATQGLIDEADGVPDATRVLQLIANAEVQIAAGYDLFSYAMPSPADYAADVISLARRDLLVLKAMPGIENDQ